MKIQLGIPMQRTHVHQLSCGNISGGHHLSSMHHQIGGISTSQCDDGIGIIVNSKVFSICIIVYDTFLRCVGTEKVEEKHCVDNP